MVDEVIVFFSAIVRMTTLGTRGFSRVEREFSVLAEGRHIFSPSHLLHLRIQGNE